MQRQGKTDLQIRGVPIATRDRVRARARASGRSMSEYVLALIDRDLGRPTLDEWFAEVRRLGPMKLKGRPLGLTSADLIRDLRGPLPPRK